MQQNDGDVVAYMQAIENNQQREDCRAIWDMMKWVVGEDPKNVGYHAYWL